MKDHLIRSKRQAALVQAVIEALMQGENLLREIDDVTYRRTLPVAFNASIGGHYRHCLDHFRSLLQADTSDELNYDHRERGTTIERDRLAALAATQELREAFDRWSPDLLNHALAVTCKTSYAVEDSQTASSTVSREIMYVVAHAVHHYALMGIMCGLMGVNLPPGFGVAPSTLKPQLDGARAAA